MAYQIAGPQTRHNLALVGEDELADGASIKCSNILMPFSAQTPTPRQGLAFAPALGLPDMYTNVDLQRITSLALELFVKAKEYSQTNFASCNCPLKA